MKAQVNIMDQILDSSQSRNSKSVSNKKGGNSTNGTSSLSLPKTAQQKIPPSQPAPPAPAPQKNPVASIGSAQSVKQITNTQKTEETLTSTTIAPELAWVYENKVPTVDNMNELLAYAVSAQEACLPPISKKLAFDAINRLVGLLKRHHELLDADTATCKKTREEYRGVQNVIKGMKKEIERLNEVNEMDRETILEREEEIEDALASQKSKKKEEGEPVNFTVSVKAKTGSQLKSNQLSPAKSSKGPASETPGIGKAPFEGSNSATYQKTGGSMSSKSKKKSEPQTKRNLKQARKELLSANISLKEKRLQCIENVPVICPEEDGFPLGEIVIKYCNEKKGNAKFVQISQQCQETEQLIKENEKMQLEVMMERHRNLTLITEEKARLNELQKKLEALEQKDEAIKDQIFEKETKMSVLRKVLEVGPETAEAIQMLQEVGVGLEEPPKPTYVTRQLNASGNSTKTWRNSSKGNSSKGMSPMSAGFSNSVRSGKTRGEDTVVSGKSKGEEKNEEVKTKYNFLKPAPIEMQFNV